MKRVLIGFVFAGSLAASVRGEDPTWTRTEDVIYGRKFGTALTMDVFRPREKANGAAVIWAVSGGFVSNHDAIRPALVAEFGKRGYTVFAVCHACQPKFTIPEILEDMHRAVRFIRHHAKEYEIDPDRIGITGASAGGHLSLMQGTAGTKGNPAARDPVDRESSRVQAVACFFPATDFLNFGTKGYELNASTAQPPFRAAFDYREFDPMLRRYVPVTDENKIREIARKVSPVYHVNAESAPTLIIHGDMDTLVPIQQAELMMSRLKEAGVPAELIVRKGAGHGWATLPADMKFIADWFDKYLAKK